MLSSREPMERATNEEEQCQAQIGSGQCKMKALVGADYCQIHNGYAQLDTKRKEGLYDLKRSLFLAGNSALEEKHKYDLSAELGVCRTMLGELLAKIDTFETMLQYNGQILALVDKIQKLSDSVLKADQKLGSLLSEDDAFELAQGLIDTVHTVLSDHIDDDTVFAKAMESVGEKLEEVLAKSASTKE